MAVTVQSFSYKRGLPRGLDMVFDCRFLRNPYWDRICAAWTGAIRQWPTMSSGDPRFAVPRPVRFASTLLLPAYEAEGKAYLSIGFGCTGGQHRSVAMAETWRKALANSGWQVSIRHRELERRGATPAEPACDGPGE